MKYTPVLFLLIAIMAFISPPSANFSGKEFRKNYARVKEHLYVGRYEVANADYRDFLSELLEDRQIDIYRVFLPDTNCWRSETNYNEPYVAYYFRDPNFNEYPVVGVSYDAAKAYCAWLTKKYNEYPKRKFKQVIFRLLTKDEWIFAANKGDSSKVYTWGTGFMQNNRKKYLCNFKYTRFVYDSLTKKYNEFPDTVMAFHHGTIIPGPVNSFYPNSFGIYNMCGNVAEMTEEKGIARGGGYDDPSYKVRISSEKNYTKPASDIGFRVAMQVIEE